MLDKHNICTARPWELLALGLIAGGGLGNGIERLSNTGVVDFVKLNYPWGGSWPVFNVADALVVVGGCTLYLTYSKKTPKRDAPPAPPPPNVT